MYVISSVFILEYFILEIVLELKNKYNVLLWLFIFSVGNF